jgi:oligoribonuclease NrnB/cAMP/cGMP phosphodiesterase (DHH superfamily)
MPKITLKDIKKMIIREFRTGSAYFDDEYHEAFDFRLAPYENFINTFGQLVERLIDDMSRDDLNQNELESLRDDLLERAQDALSSVVRSVEAKLKDLQNPENEEF